MSMRSNRSTRTAGTAANNFCNGLFALSRKVYILCVWALYDLLMFMHCSHLPLKG